jgi:hypothetical protein
MVRGELVAMLNIEGGAEDQLEAIIPIADANNDDAVAEQVISFIIQHLNELPSVESGVAVLSIEELGIVFELGFSAREGEGWESSRLH